MKKEICNDRLFVRIPEKLKKQVFKRSAGIRMSAGEFIRSAIKEKLENTKFFEVKL